MVILGDISNRNGNLLKAVELWNTARLLFERSSQAKEVQGINKRLACVEHDIMKQYKENIAHLVELNVLSSNPRNIEDGEQIELADEHHVQVVV
jgi:hypothetical protein